MKLGYSFCPNDTYIFHALTHGLVDSGLGVQELLDDVEGLNQRAGRAELELTKVSCHAFFQVKQHYWALQAGAALGRGIGPLLVAKPGADLARGLVLTPGAWTSAHLLLQMARPELKNLGCCRYDQVIPALLQGQAEAGVIIHESRFSYAHRGLEAVLDLGQWWEQLTDLPVPLGLILARRDLEPAMISRVESAIRASLELAQANPEPSRAYIRQHAQELADEVIEQHIQTYVNSFSLDLGQQGRQAVESLYRRACDQGLVKECPLPLFATS